MSRIVFIEAAVWLALLVGCAARGPSSTDAKFRVVKPDCMLFRSQAGIRKVCCVGERCWIAD